MHLKSAVLSIITGARKPSDPHHLRFVHPARLVARQAMSSQSRSAGASPRAHGAGYERGWWTRKVWNKTLPDKRPDKPAVALQSAATNPRPNGTGDENKAP